MVTISDAVTPGLSPLIVTSPEELIVVVAVPVSVRSERTAFPTLQENEGS